MASIAEELAERLAGFTPGHEEEAALHAMRELLARGAAAFHRSEYEPGHFTASAFVLSPEGGELLLIEHRTLGRWLQPGGHIEAVDATVLDAARRELREETGVTDAALLGGLFDLDVHLIPLGKAPAHRHFDLRFLFRAATRALEISEEVRGARWCSLEEISRLNTDESVLRAVRKLRARAR